MEIEVTFLETRGNAVMRRSRRITVLRLRNGVRFGRGTENEVQLPDIRVDLVAAVLFPRGDKFSIQATGPSSLRVNARTTRSAIVEPGSEILIGPYRIQLAEPSPGCDATLLIELVQPMGDALGRLLAQAQGGGRARLFSRRGAAWIGVLVIILLCLLAPIAVHFSAAPPTTGATPKVAAGLTPISLLWEPGELSNSHRFFAENCTTCHEGAFARVPDKACLGCHGEIGSHTKGGVEAADLAHQLSAAPCTQCHQEHRGRRGIVISESALCLDCHASMTATTPASPVRDVKGFPGHPQIRATVVSDPTVPTFARFELGRTPPPVDRPGIKFSHAAHLVSGGFPALGYKTMGCADCHKTETSGEGFLPVTYKDNCERCHALAFERQDLPWPNGKLPHGDDAGITAAVWNFYAGKVLQGGIADTPAPATIRRAPGASAPAAAAPTDGDGAAWATEKTRVALKTIIFDEKRGCAYCHFGTGPEGAFDLSSILPVGMTAPSQAPSRIIGAVVMRNRFLPHARFDHAKHVAMSCEQCHPARKAETSSTLLIPGIENCQGCHGSERSPLRAESTCITCHRFHNRELGPMRAVSTAPQ